jgi:integrase/recombinase XerD
LAPPIEPGCDERSGSAQDSNLPKTSGLAFRQDERRGKLTIARNPGDERADEAGWPWSHRKAFLEGLATQGYSAATIQEYRTISGRFCDIIEKRGLQVVDLDGTTMERLRHAVLSGVTGSARSYAKFCARRFIEHLIEFGAASPMPPPAKKPTALARLRDEYESYLRTQRGLADSTIENCRHYMERFLTFRFGDKLGDLNAITPDDIVAFLCKLKEGSKPRHYKALPSHLRSLFNFLFWSGKTKRDLAVSLPRVATAADHLPRYLRPEEIQRLVESVRTDDAIGRRNYAMLLLMARLGLRAPEVIAIQLNDIDWRAGEILIRGKGKLHDRMPIPADVGEAIVDYIKNGRAGTSRTLFVSAKTPHHRPFKDAKIINMVLEDAFQRTGLKPPQKYVGSHLLRHSLATDMLRKGASLDEVGDVLRHRSRMSTTIYAKYDLDALRSISRPWPVGGDVR